MAVTLASDSIFKSFYSQKKTDALLHGHSYTAYPVGCAVASETLRTLDEMARNGSWDDARLAWSTSQFGGRRRDVWSFWDPDFVDMISRQGVVKEVMALGTVLAITIKDKQAG
jgi:dethiobiotin synthetase/adenosylmethionine--8-amino-7-oxononanoate aminotransferase